MSATWLQEMWFGTAGRKLHHGVDLDGQEVETTWHWAAESAETTFPVKTIHYNAAQFLYDVPHPHRLLQHSISK